MPHRTDYAPACDQPGADPDLWYREDAESMSIARRLCGNCDLRDACLGYAMTFPDEDQWGVWGGETAAGRRALRAADPERWPVQVATLETFLGSRADRFGEDRYTPYEYRPMERPPVDWAAVDAEELDDRVINLLDRYQDVTELGDGGSRCGGNVFGVSNEVAA
jgi:hypothetical protein